MDKELVKSLCDDLAMELPEKITFEELEEKLSAYINHLINTNFQHLIFILYKIDISETKLKQLIRENTTENAGKIIARLIIERQNQKIEYKKQFGKSTNQNSAEEKW
ncbi:MAG TPA: hypothetical protein VFN30_07535 [Chitinophagaceae bacterium]|nr:hypothetical protein [Chitinophagaceae bacterium]